MRIKPKHFDVGEVVMQHKIQIEPNFKQPELHNILGELGATSLVSVLHQLPEFLKQAKPQQDIGVSFGKNVQL